MERWWCDVVDTIQVSCEGISSIALCKLQNDAKKNQKEEFHVRLLLMNCLSFEENVSVKMSI